MARLKHKKKRANNERKFNGIASKSTNPINRVFEFWQWAQKIKTWNWNYCFPDYGRRKDSGSRRKWWRCWRRRLAAEDWDTERRDFWRNKRSELRGNLGDIKWGKLRSSSTGSYFTFYVFSCFSRSKGIIGITTKISSLLILHFHYFNLNLFSLPVIYNLKLLITFYSCDN